MKTILQLLINHFLFAGALFFAAGAVADVGGGDASSSGTVADPAADTSDTTDTGSDDGTAADADAAQVDDGSDAAAVDAVQDKADGRVIPAALRAHIETIKKTDPALAGQLKDMAYAASAFKKEFPGGLKEAQSIKAAIEQHGGLEAIGTMQQDLAAVKGELDAIDTKFAAGDPEYLNTIIAQSPEGFAKLMPLAAQKWSAVDPEGYQRTMSNVLVSTLRESGFSSEMRDLTRELARGQVDVEECKKIAQRMSGWMGELDKLATAKPAANAAPDKREQDLTQREQAIKDSESKRFDEGIGTSFLGWFGTEFETALKGVLPAGKTLKPEAQEIVKGKVMQEVGKLLSKDEKFVADLDKLRHAAVLDDKKKADMLKLIQSRWAQQLPEATKRVYRTLYADATLGAQKPKPAAGKPNGADGKPNPPADKGYIKLAKGPAPYEIDTKQFDKAKFKDQFDMVFHKHAILKDGRKVCW